MMQDDEWEFDYAEVADQKAQQESEQRAESAAEAGVKYPHIEVQLSGEDGNAFVIASRVRGAIRRAEGEAAAAAYFEEALSGDYDHVLQTTMRTVVVA